jgi:hypothetical protein
MQTLVFTCNGKDLASVHDVMAINDGKSQQGYESDDRMEFTPGKGFYFRGGACTAGAQTDLDGRVLKSGRGCPNVGDSIFSQLDGQEVTTACSNKNVGALVFR